MDLVTSELMVYCVRKLKGNAASGKERVSGVRSLFRERLNFRY